MIELPCVNYDFPPSRQNWNGLVLVGEAPGREEVRQGHPFVGRSGQLLGEMLAEAGIERSRTIVANVFRFQPPDNKVDHFFISRRKAAAQGIGLAEEFGQFGSAWCRADFADEIRNLKTTLAEWNPRLIIALGRTPFWALTGENGLMACVGKPFDCRLLSGTSVIPTYHPSFILRGNWALRPQWLGHFQEAVAGASLCYNAAKERAR